MGFGSWIKEKYNAAKTAVKEFVSDAVDVAKDVYQKGKELASAVGTAVTETVKGWMRPKPDQDWGGGQSKTNPGTSVPPKTTPGDSSGGQSKNNTGSNSGGSTNGKSQQELKAELGVRIDLIDQYQKQARKEAKIYEDIAKEAYKKKYEQIVKALGEVMDTKHIQNFINSKSQIFSNLMRNEINSAITYGNRQLKRLMNDTSLSRKEYSDKIQDYVDTIYDQTKDNLLAELQKAFSETDSYIRINAKKFLQDEQEVLKGLKNTMNNLSKEGDAKERELEKIGNEYATLAFVRSLANKKED